ncbi:hypothetical protein TIFTF001_035615 [Ficus carica]|uniref:Uncharacterized protein n=1 Tax=Ficus carica TaxID=3494 RepID=A0AA88E2L7_FICCA|nr:hypothetical protein TIFTF001_035615 [Ficus carica]
MVSNLPAIVDTRWRSLAWGTVKRGSLLSWYQSGFLQSNFTVSLPSPPSLYDVMDPRRVEEDCYTAYAFNGMQPLLFDGTHRTVSLSAWLYDIEMIFHICHIEAHLQVSLASICLIGTLTLRSPWTIIAALSGGDVATYSTGYRQPGNAGLSDSLQQITSPFRQYILAPTPDMTMGHMIEFIMDAEVIAHAMQADAYVVEPQVPVDDAAMGQPVFEAGPLFPEDPIPTVPVQEVPAQGARIEDPPIIDISSDDEDDGEEPEHDPRYGGWLDEGDDFEDDPEEVLYDDGDWDADSDASVVTIEYID